MTQRTASPFYPTRAARVELARKRYFDEGIAPSGVVSDAVFQSWTRCQRLHGDPGGKVAFQPVTASRTHLSLQKNRDLRNAWFEQLPALENAFATTSCAVMLTDASGVLIGATCVGRAHERLMPIATRLGVDLSEEAVGTTAPGVVARTGEPVCVLGAEHYFNDVTAMNCAASPVRDIHGRIAGVLDISSEAMPFSFDAASVVELFAGSIENRLLVAQSHEHLVIHMQVAAPLLDSPVVGLVGVNAAGRLAWCNGVASRLLGLHRSHRPDEASCAQEARGSSISELASLPASGASALTLPNGLRLWARSSMRAPDGRRNVFGFHRAAEQPHATIPLSGCLPAWEGGGEVMEGAVPRAACNPADEHPTDTETAVAGEPMSLRDSDRDVIERTVKECGGNISTAAKKLRVSRGLVYRRLRNSAAHAVSR